jgi:hypothetical protein
MERPKVFAILAWCAMLHFALPAPAESAPAARPAAEKPGPNPAPVDDTAVRLAQLGKEQVEAREKKLDEALKALAKNIEAMGPGRFDAEKLVIDDLKKVVPALRRQAKQLLAAHAAYTKNSALMPKTYAAAAQAFRDASAVYARYQGEEDLPELKEEYGHLAEAARKLSGLMDKRATEQALRDREIAATLRFVERYAIFLERLEAFIALYPDVGPAADAERYAAQLRSFMERFNALLKSLQQWRAKLDAEAVPPPGSASRPSAR